MNEILFTLMPRLREQHTLYKVHNSHNEPTTYVNFFSKTETAHFRLNTRAAILRQPTIL